MTRSVSGVSTGDIDVAEGNDFDMMCRLESRSEVGMRNYNRGEKQREKGKDTTGR